MSPLPGRLPDRIEKSVFPFALPPLIMRSELMKNMQAILRMRGMNRFVGAGARVRTGLVLALTIAVSGPGSVFSQIQDTRVTGGELQGVVKDGVASFKGIPFAAPPIGELRWKPPRPVKPWSGIRK